jgi:hypothetical protein
MDEAPSFGIHACGRAPIFSFFLIEIRDARGHQIFAKVTVGTMTTAAAHAPTIPKAIFDIDVLPTSTSRLQSRNRAVNKISLRSQ